MTTLEDLAAQHSSDRGSPGYSVAPGVVTNNVDLMSEGMVQVRVPSLPDLEPWCRVVSVGGGKGRGFFWLPQIGDEVLVAFNANDIRDAYILGGLWSTIDRPPVTTFAQGLVQRVIKTGTVPGVGHEIELDDLQQSITITTSTKQKIKMDPTAIEITNLAGSVDIKLDNLSQTVSIQAIKKIDLQAAEISLNGLKVSISGGVVNIDSKGPCSVTGLPIKLN
jgi:uncharacterized protein involved in type VI secretion and phage assembly